nr:DUF5696 domain-containing protein [Paenibacillus sacheonensis]
MTWVQAAQDGDASLWVDPPTGKVALESGGIILTSNPTPEELAEETSKGQNRSNLESPLLFRYQPEGRTADTSSNVTAAKAKVKWRTIDDGIGFQYEMADLGFTVYIEYRLNQGQLVAHIPELGIAENKKNELTSLDVLPYFGAARNDAKDGYLLVPDGPGALIRFGKTVLDNVQPYNFPIYDQDPSAPSGDLLNGDMGSRTGIAYPVFGINRGNGGYIGIVEEGVGKTNIVASPAGIGTGFNQANARMILRRFYEEKISTTKSNFQFEEQLISQSFTSRYVPLGQGASDYVAMAKAYREYLIGHAHAAPLGDPSGPPPLQLNVLLGTKEMNANGSRFVAATTLAEAGRMAEKLKKDGIDAMQVGLEGWQNGGYPGDLPDRFPVASAVGGDAGMKSLAAKLKSLGVPLYLNDALQVAMEKFGNGFSVGKEAARGISGISINPKLFNQSGEASSYYLLNPQRMLNDTIPAAIKGYKKLGVSGVNLLGLGGLVYGDFNAAQYVDRESAIKLEREAMAKLKEASLAVTASGAQELQGGTNGAYAYGLGIAGHLAHFPMDYNYDIVVDEQVPFYPIAVHGLATYSGTEGNLHPDPQVDFLREIEYGALPTYLVTEKNPGTLARTSFSWLYSSQFSVWEPRIAETYRAFEETSSGVWGSFIDNHRKLADGVYETTYAGGRRIWVNYNDADYTAEGHSVKAMSYAVVEKGGAQ